jgi:membrane protein implicated in regulation of membrane protease activity
MFDEFLNHPALAWVFLAVVFGLIEIMTPSFVFLFAAIAALLAAGASFLVLGWQLQVLVFSIGLFLGFGLFRRRLLARFQGNQQLPSRTEALIGKKGVVTVASDPTSGPGRVLVEGHDWAAQSDQPLHVGCAVEVVGSESLILKVKEI